MSAPTSISPTPPVRAELWWWWQGELSDWANPPLQALYTNVPTSDPATLTSVVISTSNLSNYNPRGYSFSSLGSLTVDTGGDGTIIAPLLFRGGLSSQNSVTISSANGVNADSIA